MRSAIVRIAPPTAISMMQGVYVKKFNSLSQVMQAACIYIGYADSAAIAPLDAFFVKNEPTASEYGNFLDADAST